MMTHDGKQPAMPSVRFPFKHLLFVDANHEIHNAGLDPRRYERDLEVSLRLCLMLAKDRVLHPIPHLFENNTFSRLVLRYEEFFHVGVMDFVSKLGIDFGTILAQRTQAYAKYPPLLLRGYHSSSTQRLAASLPPALEIRHESMTAGVETRLLYDLEERVEETTAPAKSRSWSTSFAPHLGWLKRFLYERQTTGEPLLFQVLAESPRAPQDPNTLQLLRRRLFEHYWSQAEEAYQAYACSYFVRPYPKNWLSSGSRYFDLRLLSRVLNIVGLARPIAGISANSFLEFLHTTERFLLRDWYERICWIPTTSADLLQKVALTAAHRPTASIEDGAEVLDSTRSVIAKISRRSSMELVYFKADERSRRMRLQVFDWNAIPAAYDHLREDIEHFHSDVAFEASVFVMMKFPEAHMESRKVTALRDIFGVIKDELDRHGLVARRADKKTYARSKLLWDNLCVYMIGCAFGIAVLEDCIGNELNPNVALEYGFMKGIGREVILLVEQGFRNLRADFTGTIPKIFTIWSDYSIDERSLQEAVANWLIDLGIPPRRAR